MQNASQTPYPLRFPGLAFLGFLALAWIIVNQFRAHLGLHAGANGLVAKGYLGAQLYFVVSGFLLAHAWAASGEAGGATYRSRVGRWLANVYPLHIAMLAVMGLMVAAAEVQRITPYGVFDVRGIVANVAMLQAWGVTPTVTWNFPSWLISAQLAGLLAFPAFAKLALDRPTPPWLVIGAAALLFNAMFLAAEGAGVLFTGMTAQIGALQPLPAFLMGAGLYALGREHSLSAPWAKGLALLALAWIVAGSLLELTDIMIWPAFPLLVYSVAETAKSDKPILAWAPLSGLGRSALSIYLVYLPVDIAYFHAWKALAPTAEGAFAWAIWGGVFPVILITGLAADRFIAEPAARFLEGLFGPPAALNRASTRALGRRSAWRGLAAR